MSITAPRPSGRPPKKEPEWADASALLEGAAKLLDATADIRSMTEAGEHARRVKASREQHLQKVQKDLRALSRALEEAKLASQRPPTAPSESDHVNAMEALDQARFAAAKTIMENDIQIQAKMEDSKRLKEEIAEWEKRDPVDEHEPDSAALRGRILKEMGFAVKSDATGNVEKVIVRGQSGDIRVLPISADGDPYEQAKQLWEINSS